jgi:hypothetical protein
MKMAVFWVFDRPDGGGSKDLLNVGKLIRVYTALQPRRESPSVLTSYLKFQCCSA